jgi:hypothetical protein
MHESRAETINTTTASEAAMSGQHLATYLNDHLAGSTAALELLDHLEKTHTLSSGIGCFVSELRVDIAADRQELEALMQRLRISVSTPRTAAAWLAEKVTELKLRLEDKPRGAFHLFEALEAISLGVEGKRLLWTALAAAAPLAPELEGTDYAYLEQRALEQRQRIELARLETARTVFAAKSTASTRG